MNTISVCMGGAVTRSFPLQPIVTAETLRNIHNGAALSQTVIDAYNRYTEEINRETWHTTRETLLDNRHRFYVQAMQDQKQA